MNVNTDTTMSDKTCFQTIFDVVLIDYDSMSMEQIVQNHTLKNCLIRHILVNFIIASIFGIIFLMPADMLTGNVELTQLLQSVASIMSSYELGGLIGIAFILEVFAMAGARNPISIIPFWSLMIREQINTSYLVIGLVATLGAWASAAIIARIEVAIFLSYF